MGSNRPRKFPAHVKEFAAKAIASFLGIVGPSYLVERITEYYYQTGNPLFGFWSGARIWFFIALILVAALASGSLFRDFVPAAACSVVGIAGLLLLLYVLCGPRACYSTGLDGLEPVRIGLYLSSLSVIGASFGIRIRTRKPHTTRVFLVVSFATFVVIAYYPVVFEFAGTTLLGQFHPWGASVLLAILSFSIGVAISERFGLLAGLVLPPFFGLAVILSSIGIASAYLLMVDDEMLLMGLALVAGAAIGALVMSQRRALKIRRVAAAKTVPLLAVALLVLMTIVVYPDAVVGMIPQGGGAPMFQMGTPVYIGGYMDAGLNSTKAESMTVNFSGTNLSSIQGDNYLAAGIGAHSPGCCVDGIDYGYRFDVYLFRSGNEALAASAWEVCDYNAACGGHSWKTLIFFRSVDIGRANLSSEIKLMMGWTDHTVVWGYEMGTETSHNFTSFAAQPQEKPYFNTGLLRGSAGSAMSGYYFFQFGIMSRYPIGRGGWSVIIGCPAYVGAAGWTCAGHARSLNGGQSYWKVLWRWGEDYPNVRILPDGPHQAEFSYSPSSPSGNFYGLW